MATKIEWEKWGYGLASGFIFGFASAIDSSLALMVLVPEKFNLSDGLKRTLLTALILGILTGAKCAFAYLKKSPLPDSVEVDTTTLEIKKTFSTEGKPKEEK